MYDLHTHSLLSDGVLLPSEVAIRYQRLGYKVIAVCDHADYSNIENVVNSILNFTRNWPQDSLIKVLPGVELTHLPLAQFKPLAKYARERGAKIIIGHGQTPAEPVFAGTNRAALEADIDILAHPGEISDDDINFAKERGIFLEITSRKGHCNTNSYVARRSLKLGAKLILNSDSHLPQDILSPAKLKKAALKAGISPTQIDCIFQDVEEFLKKRGAVE